MANPRGGAKAAAPKQPPAAKLETPIDSDVELEDPPSVDPWAQRNLEYMSNKLRAVGMTDGELEEFAAQWLDPDWAHEEKVLLLSLGDVKLAAELERTRQDGMRDTTTEAEERELVESDLERGRLAAIRDEAEVQSELEIDDVLAWAGADRERLVAALDVEQSHPQPRGDLVAEIEARLS